MKEDHCETVYTTVAFDLGLATERWQAIIGQKNSNAVLTIAST